jgi:hypothetical protein
MIRPHYRNEFEKDGLEKVRDNVLHHPCKTSEQQKDARTWIEETERVQHRAYEKRAEIAAWLAVFSLLLRRFSARSYIFARPIDAVGFRRQSASTCRSPFSAEARVRRILKTNL